MALRGHSRSKPDFDYLVSGKASAYTYGDSDVISFHIYASWFSPPFCGYNMTQRVELMGEDLLRYSDKIESSDLRQCPCDH